ncbi:neuropeptide Y receptor type 1-like [Clytia hemisphaerica]|uniref:G-protein coupled receptors family 1 profile domain-containing protein n=1 Tax=Clytia hemisphaerica TaxID=252671 RepID=A0A7M6DQI9_9CNID|eukprot:TCONS_00053863-protein
MNSHEKFTLKDYVFVIAFTLIFVTGVIGNSLVIYIFKHRQRRITTPMELIIIYLAVTDLIASVFNSLLYIYLHITSFSHWDFGPFMCVLLPSITTVSVSMSLGLIILITIERCRVLSNPFDGMFDKKHVHYMVAFVFIISIANEIPYIKDLHITHRGVATYKCVKSNLAASYTQKKGIEFKTFPESCNKNKTLQSFEHTLSTYDETTLFSCVLQSCHEVDKCMPRSTQEYMKGRLITLVIRDVLFISVFTVCNLFIYQALKGDDEREKILKQSGINHTRINPTKMCIMILALAIVFAVLVLPKDIYHIVYLARLLNKDHSISGEKAVDINSALKLLQSFNCVANVFIYARLHGSFRKSLNEVFTTIISSTDK